LDGFVKIMITQRPVDKLRRTHVYRMHPSAYEIAGCPVSSEHEVEWSEFEHHLWCSVCKKDFLPTSNGVFDGPIPIGAFYLVGISFDRINIQTGEVVKNPFEAALLANREVTEREIEKFNSTWRKQ
jgi:hypothetical protein